MPTYEYECTKCGHAFEEFRPMSAPPRARCPKCRGRVQRVLSAGAGIVFRGSGWYVKDSRRSGTKQGSPDGAAKDARGAIETDGSTKAKAGDPPDATGVAPKKTGAGGRVKSSD